MPGKALVIDANILVRAVLGKRVREVLEKYSETATFFVPNAAAIRKELHIFTRLSGASRTDWN